MSIWKNKVMLGSLGLNFMCRYSVILNWINILVLEHADGNLYINVLNENPGYLEEKILDTGSKTAPTSAV